MISLQHNIMESSTKQVIVMMLIICDVIFAASEDSNKSSSMTTTLITSSSSSVLHHSAPMTASTQHQQMTSASRFMTTEQAMMSTYSSPQASTVTAQTTLPANVANDETMGHTVSATVHIRYNCLRPRTKCMGDGSTCSSDDARCRCADGLQGYDCSLTTKSVVSACDPPCLNGGTCYAKSLNETYKMYLCSCTEAFYGDSCEKERVYHKCNPNSMEMHVAPIVGSMEKFTGSIYVKGQEDKSQCVFMADEKDGSAYIKTIEFTDCGRAENKTDTTSGMTSLSWRVVVRYDDILLETDQELTFTCYLRQPGDTYDWHAWMISNDNMINSQLPSRTVVSDVQPVLMSLETIDGKPVIGPQQLGTILQLRYVLNGGNVYDSFRVEKIAVSNSLTGVKRHVFNLVADSCVTDDAHQIKKIVQSFDHNNESEVVLKFKVFKLRYSNQLIFENVIKACRNSVDCQPAECGRAHSLRKKRSVNETVAEKTMKTAEVVADSKQAAVYNKANATLTVWYLGDDNSYDDSECSRSPTWLHNGQRPENQLRNILFIVVASVIVVAILVAVGVVVTYVCFRLWRKR